MASGNESPRQKMINLMYLIFIAMLALNMSKEVLSAFGVINEEIENSTQIFQENSEDTWKGLKALAEDPETGLQYKEVFTVVDSIYQMGNNLDRFIESIKPPFTYKKDRIDENRNGSFTDTIKDFEAMDKTNVFDELFFVNKPTNDPDTDGLTQTGIDYVNSIREFKKNSIALLEKSDADFLTKMRSQQPDKTWFPIYTQVIKDINDKFKTDQKVKGKKKLEAWIKYHYEGYPLISSLTKMSLIQDNIQKIISKTMSTALGSNAAIVGGTNTLKAVVVPGFYDNDNKWINTASTVYEGENFKGKIILAKYDSTLAPNKIKIIDYFEGSGSQAIAENKLIAGQVILNLPSPTTGRKNLTGSLEFDLQKGTVMETTEIAVDYEYEVTKRPTSANIANVRMDVVYKAVPNYLAVSIPNVSTENLIVKANGKKLSGSFKNINKIQKWVYTISNPQPTKGKKGVIDIVVTTKEYEGSPALGPFNVPFRIKDLPSPISTFAGSSGFKSYSKSVLRANEIAHQWPEDFELGTLSLVTREFFVQVGNNSPVKNTGPKFRGTALKQINSAKKGTIIIIYNIKSQGKTNKTYNKTTPEKLVIKVK